MEFEADISKAAENLRKHKVSFEEAASVFGDSLAYTFADPDHSIAEHRWLVLGMSKASRVLAVVYTNRNDRYRIISARGATRHERQIYEEG